MALLLDSASDTEEWLRAFRRLDPALGLRAWPATGAAEEIEAALVWRPACDDFRRFPRLAAIFNLGAGVDLLLCRGDLPAQVPIVRLVDPVGLTAPMSEYVLWQVLRLHRRGPELEALAGGTRRGGPHPPPAPRPPRRPPRPRAL